MRFACLAVLLALAATATAPAAPPIHEHIATDAVWLAHADLEKAAGSSFGRLFIDGLKSVDAFDDAADVDWIRDMTEGLGIKMGRDLHAITAYGGDDPGAASIAVLWYGNAGLDKWTPFMLEHAGSQQKSIEVDGRVVDALYTPSLEEWDVPITLDGDRRVWVTAWTKATAAAATKVVQAGGNGLAADTKLVPRSGAGTFAFVSAVELDGFEDFEPASQIAREAETFWLALGERENDAFIQTVITVGDDGDASSIADVLRGMVALGRLTIAKDPDVGPDVTKLLDGIRFEADGPRVTMQLTQDVQTLRRVLDEVDE